MGDRNIREDTGEAWSEKENLVTKSTAVFRYLQDEQALLEAGVVHWNSTQWLRSKAKGRNAAHTVWPVILASPPNPKRTPKHLRPEETGLVRAESSREPWLQSLPVPFLCC